MKFWVQSYLLGVPEIICGFRDDDGVVRKVGVATCRWEICVVSSLKWRTGADAAICDSGAAATGEGQAWALAT
jgi:hypothetical protein